MKWKTLRGAQIVVCVFFGMLLASVASAEIVVIVHPENQNKMSRSDIARIFTGKSKSFPDGTSAIAIDQKKESLSYAAFAAAVLQMNPKALKMYWARLMFSGNAMPPQVVEDGQKVKDMVSKDPAMIGYIDSSIADASVHVIRLEAQ